MKLVKFKDLELDEIHYRYMNSGEEEQDVICACCGGVFEAGEEGVTFQILDDYDLSEEEIMKIMEE